MRAVSGETPRQRLQKPRRRDPAPSRIGFRLKRMWRSARLRRAVIVYAPLLAAAGVVGWTAAQPHLRAAALETVEDWRAEITARPEFAVRRIEVRGAGPEVTAQVRAALEPWLGASSLGADATEIRRTVAALGWVRRARVRLAAPETLIVSVKERAPAMIWRDGETLTLLDETGAHIAPLAARADRPELPVIAGPGADAAAAEARGILAAAGAIAPRVRGLVRVGERRWNAVLADGPTVMLPARGGADAMGLLAAMQAGEDVLGRDVSHIDLRLGSRPTLRLRPDAKRALEAARAPRKPGEDA